MTTGTGRFIAALLSLVLLFQSTPRAWADEPTAPADTQEEQNGRTPPRLSYVNGEASFFRPGADEWAPAQLNTPLAPGDELYTGHRGNLEIQIGAREFVRAWGDTQLGLLDQEANALQFKVTAGYLALDLREVEPGRSVEVSTPQAALTIEAPGYYRVDVASERTSIVARRGGRATLTTASAAPTSIGSDEQVVLDGADAPALRRLAAPPLDVWDTWNSTRSEHLVATVSESYVPSGVYGASDLDRHGDWRAVPEYGSVWVPRGVAPGWAPYSTGRWIADPYYGWTWVDEAPWGWAPYHYGRWVYVNGYWAWAPGPVVVRPVYSPALVAFFGGPGVRVAVGTPFVSWVALGWGEPLVPWWGPPRFVGRPWWGGWGGPRVVNNVVVHRSTVVNVRNVTVYRNTRVRSAVVAVREDGFGRRAVREARVTNVDMSRLEPVHGRLHVKPDARSFVAADGRGRRPPEQTVSRRVITTRPSTARPELRDGDRRDGDRRRESDRRESDRRDADRRDGDRRERDRREGDRAQRGGATSAPRADPAPKSGLLAPSTPSSPPAGPGTVDRPRPTVPPRGETERRSPQLDGRRGDAPRGQARREGDRPPRAAATPAPRIGPAPKPDAPPPSAPSSSPPGGPVERPRPPSSPRGEGERRGPPPDGRRDGAADRSQGTTATPPRAVPAPKPSAPVPSTPAPPAPPGSGPRSERPAQRGPAPTTPGSRAHGAAATAPVPSNRPSSDRAEPGGRRAGFEPARTARPQVQPPRPSGETSRPQAPSSARRGTGPTRSADHPAQRDDAPRGR
jgi:hypothetical protein